MPKPQTLPTLHLAAWKGDVQAVRDALGQTVVDERDGSGATALHRAALLGHTAVAQVLVDAGADVAARDREGWTPLHYAAREGHVDLARLLLDRGAPIDAEDRHGNTPLWRALFAPADEIVGVLLGHGADADRRNKAGASPRSLAATIANRDLKRFFR